jgi:poly(3-hydroxybutyrate) depolymerase
MATAEVFHVLRTQQGRFFAFLREFILKRPQKPRWSTPNRVVWERPACCLRDFGGRGQGEPVALIIPPEVNHSAICDLAPENSLPRAFLQANYGRVLVLEWRNIDATTAGRDVDDSIADIIYAAESAGQPVHLVGLCQGGWESAVVAALRPDLTASLTLVAAPIDFSAGLGQIRLLSRLLPMSYYRWLTRLGGGAMRGEFISAGFDLLQPFERGLLRPLQVWNRLDQPQWLERFSRMQNWYRSPKDLPGPAYLRIVRELFKENRLVRGSFMVLGRPVRLENIRCPLALVAGARDQITPPAQLWAAEHCVSSRRVLKVLTEGGHVGTFMGSAELKKHWPGIISWLKESEEVKGA